MSNPLLDVSRLSLRGGHIGMPRSHVTSGTSEFHLAKPPKPRLLQ
jgi:hypothetical protein